MSRLIFQRDYIIVIPTYHHVEMHKHMMQHMFIGNSECVLMLPEEVSSGNIIFLESGIKHANDPNHSSQLFLLIDTTSALARQIRERYLKGKSYTVLSHEMPIDCDTVNDSDINIAQYVENLLFQMNLRDNDNRKMDERIDELLQFIKHGKAAALSVTDLAKKMALSPSRLTHLFRQQTGVGLKNFLLLNKLKGAYQSVIQGKSMTEAALENGFSDSAHLSATCKNLTGISMSQVMRT